MSTPTNQCVCGHAEVMHRVSRVSLERMDCTFSMDDDECACEQFAPAEDFVDEPVLTPEQQKQIDRLNAVADTNIQQQIIARDHLLQQVLTGPDPDENRRDWNESPPTLQELEAVTDEEIAAELPGIFDRILGALRDEPSGESVTPQESNPI